MYPTVVLGPLSTACERFLQCFHDCFLLASNPHYTSFILKCYIRVQDYLAAATILSASFLRCLAVDALTIMLNQLDDGRGWCSSTVHLQQVSLPLCITCRGLRRCHVRTPWGTPPWVWAPTLHEEAANSVQCCARASKASPSASRLSALHVTGLTWGLSTIGTFLEERNEFVTKLDNLIFGDHFNDEIRAVVWPMNLKRLAFGRGFNQAIKEVTWPGSLRELSFGSWFNQDIDGTIWPTSLQTLTFGDRFDRPIELVAWPDSVDKLTLGFNFDRAVSRVT